MTLSLNLLPQTMTVLRQTPGGSDAEGNPVDTEVEGEAVPCLLEPISRSEFPAGADLQEGLFNLYLLPETVLDGSDRVVVNAKQYEVVGPPAEWPDWDGGVNHIVATVRRVEV